MHKNIYFRAGAGVVLYTNDHHICIFSRTENPSVWQFPQGGLDLGENIEDCMWRELMEETAITPADIARVTQHPGWLSYEYDSSLRSTIIDPACLGQMHRWFYLQLKEDVTPRLEIAIDKEFSSYAFTTFGSFLPTVGPLKKSIFTALGTYFEQHIATS